MVHFFLDANQIVAAGYFLESHHFQVFKNYISKTKNCRLYVPRIAVDEAVRCFVRDLSGCALALRVIAKMSGSEIEVGHWYRAYLLQELDACGAIVLDYPEVPHRELVSRYVLGKRPFTSKKGDAGGYKDCLFWFSVLQVAKSHGMVSDQRYVLITEDTDFREGPGPQQTNLHPDLRAEFERLGAGDIEVITSLKIAVDRFVPSILVEGIEDQMATEFLREHESVLAARLNDQVLIDKGLREPLLRYHGLVPAQLEDPEVSWVDVDAAEVTHYYESGVGRYLAEVNAAVSAAVNGFIHKADWCEVGGMTILDRNWNEWYMWVETAVKLRLELGLLYDQGKGTFVPESLEIHSVSERKAHHEP